MLPTRREREAELARTAFIDAAIHAFARKGVHGARVEEIARHAGYSAGALYRYFDSKQALYEACIERIAGAFLEQLAEEPPIPLRFVDRIRWFLTRHFALAEAHKDYFIALIGNRVVFEWDIRTELGETAWQMHLAMVAGLGRLAQLGIDEGALRPGDPEQYGRALSGIMRALTLDWVVLPHEAPPLTDLIDPIIDLWLHGVSSREETA